MRKQDFFSKIWLRHFSPLTSEQLHTKNLRDPMVGTMRTFCYGTGRDGQTDGGYFKGPNCWSKNRVLSSKIRLRWYIVSFLIDCKAKNVMYKGFGTKNIISDVREAQI